MNDEQRREQAMADRLETAIDAAGLGMVLEILAGICNEKADHLRSNWQDERTAREWDRNARHLLQAARKVVF
jgi:hypothetical protein